jgi:CBS domain-containing protein
MGPSEFEDAYDDEGQIRGAILHEPIRTLAPKAPVCVAPGATIREAVEVMNEARVGCVLVSDGASLAGILTERDVLRLVVGKLGLDTPVDAVMTAHPECVRMEDGIAYALNKMSVGGYRHIPVVDADGRPMGLVSVRDFVRFIVSVFPAAVLNLPPEPHLGIARSAEGA